MFSSRRGLGRWFWTAAAASFVVSVTPWAPIILYPFKLFTTWVHESSHALMTVLVGGRVTSIAIERDTSGLTMSLVPLGRVPQGLVASAGYLGAAVVGCLLMVSTRVERSAHSILAFIGACMLVTLAIWIRNPFGVVVVLAWSAALLLLARSRFADAVRFLLSLLAVQVALNAVYDIRVLFFIGRGQSDAATMARLFLLPAWVWATAWMVMSLGLLYGTLRVTGGRR